MKTSVAPFMGAWIEISSGRVAIICKAVAPFMGAWIEIRENHPVALSAPGRSLHGSVD